jgi:hypothetical protein
MQWVLTRIKKSSLLRYKPDYYENIFNQVMPQLWESPAIVIPAQAEIQLCSSVF